jgi:hypothetical protein
VLHAEEHGAGLVWAAMNARRRCSAARRAEIERVSIGGGLHAVPCNQRRAAAITTGYAGRSQRRASVSSDAARQQHHHRPHRQEKPQ